MLPVGNLQDNPWAKNQKREFHQLPFFKNTLTLKHWPALTLTVGAEYSKVVAPPHQNYHV